MNKVVITSEFIKLDQFMKWAGLVDTGVDAKFLIQDNKVLVNGEVETRRGKKLYPNDVVKFQNKEYIVTVE